MIIAALRQHLLADGTVAGLVASRVYSDEMPQAPTYPAVVMYLISGPRDYDLVGSNGHAQPRVQIDSWAATKAAAVQVSEAIKSAIEDAVFSYGDVVVGPSRIDNERDIPSLLEVLPQVRGRSLDILTWTSE